MQFSIAARFAAGTGRRRNDAFSRRASFPPLSESARKVESHCADKSSASADSKELQGPSASEVGLILLQAGRFCRVAAWLPGRIFLILFHSEFPLIFVLPFYACASAFTANWHAPHLVARVLGHSAEQQLGQRILRSLCRA
jgi:hypothetical protein